MGSGASKLNDEQLDGVHVVIIGSGYGGLTVATELIKTGVKFTLIEPKEYFHHCVGALRAAVYPEEVKRTAIPLKEAFGDSFKQGRVVKLDVEKKLVTLETGEEIKFSHCVISVGSLGPVPARSEAVTVQTLQNEADTFSQAVDEAQDIVIVGGGPVGVELAGEISEKHKNKNITLVSSSDTLVSPNFDEKFQNSLKCIMDRRNVKLKIGRVDNLDKITTNKFMKQTVQIGEECLEADLVVGCIGLPPNKSAINKLVDAKHIDENGRIIVNEFLQLDGLPNIFAIGDCCNTSEDKMAAFAGKHGEVVAANIVKELMGTPLIQYKQPFTGMLVPFGKSEGVGLFNGFHIPSFIGTRLKYATLFTEKYWGMTGLKQPQ